MLRKLTPLERSFISFETESSPQTVGCILILTRECNFDLLSSTLVQAIEKYPRLSQVLKAGKWIDRKVPRKVLVRRYPGMKLSELAGILSNEKLNLYTNPWKVELLNFGENEWALAILWNHAFSDGMGGVPLIASLSNVGKPAKITKKRKYQKLSFIQRFKELRGLASHSNAQSKEKNLFPINVPEKRSVFSIELSAVKVNNLRDKYKLTSYEVFLTLLGNSFFHLINKEHLFEIIIPVSLRRHPFEAPFENHMIATSLSLPCISDISKVAAGVKSGMEVAKNSKTLSQYQAGVDLLGRFPIFLQRKLWKKALKTHLCISTGLGSIPETLEVGGSPVKTILGLPAPVNTQSFAFSWLEYGEKFILTAVVSKSREEEILTLFEFIESLE